MTCVLVITLFVNIPVIILTEFLVRYNNGRNGLNVRETTLHQRDKDHINTMVLLVTLWPSTIDCVHTRKHSYIKVEKFIKTEEIIKTKMHHRSYHVITYNKSNVSASLPSSNVLF